MLYRRNAVPVCPDVGLQLDGQLPKLLVAPNLVEKSELLLYVRFWKVEIFFIFNGRVNNNRLNFFYKFKKFFFLKSRPQPPPHPLNGSAINKKYILAASFSTTFEKGVKKKNLKKKNRFYRSKTWSPLQSCERNFLRMYLAFPKVYRQFWYTGIPLILVHRYTVKRYARSPGSPSTAKNTGIPGKNSLENP